ncbi:PulJ/GspJ family protein [Synechocystis sp. PCC 7509]|uniref:PulJ/GspJ family protein n=1 Tax=Synechocystis sp. PCC 7509 TaxID=927677 RepID=UPI0002AD1900|nr:prepilin-type N-terminal cleavage/methylation domain-containing protein [Synechocystis sp. PCC 7509]
MKTKIFTFFKSLLNWQKINQGFTLIELLVAVVISTIVISIAGFGITTILTMDNRAEATIERQVDLNRAFDFLTNEIRMAQRINFTATTAANGTTVTLDDVVASSGLNLSQLGDYGNIVLYLEIPIANSPAVCPANSPNAGFAPPEPSNHDRVVYDIRANTGVWLDPQVINRYGRIPSRDGTINPCNNPISGDIFVDAISDIDINPTNCTAPAVLSGSGGFYACTEGLKVDLYLRSRGTNTKAYNIASRAVSRLSGTTTVVLTLSRTRLSSSDTMNLAWTWTGSNNVTFKLVQRVNGANTEIYNGSALNTVSTLSGNLNDLNCYTVTAIVDSNTQIASNQVCEPK